MALAKGNTLIQRFRLEIPYLHDEHGEHPLLPLYRLLKSCFSKCQELIDCFQTARWDVFFFFVLLDSKGRGAFYTKGASTISVFT